MKSLSKIAAILGREGGKIGGKSRSPLKIAAAQKNGCKGGWPRGKKREKRT